MRHLPPPRFAPSADRERPLGELLPEVLARYGLEPGAKPAAAGGTNAGAPPGRAARKRKSEDSLPTRPWPSTARQARPAPSVGLGF